MITTFLIVIIIIFLAIGIIGILDNEFPLAFLSFPVCIIVTILAININIHTSTPIVYKVQELELNTMFTITDDNGGYNTKESGKPDTVWVNMNTLKIDAKDTSAVMCIIIKKIK